MDCQCTPTCRLPLCTGDLVIGYIQESGLDLWVYIKRLGGANRRQRLDTISSYGGVVTVDLTELPNGFLSENFAYELTVTEQQYICEPLAVRLEDDVTEATCYLLTFENTFVNTLLEPYESATLEATQ